MSKGKGRGIIAIALFELAAAQGREADATRRLAELHEEQDLVIRAYYRTATAVQLRMLERDDERHADKQEDADPSVLRITQADRARWLLTDIDTPANPDAPAFGAVVARKAARIIALRMLVPFVVETDRGLMEGQAGDWLATNHPEDDPGSDIWTISDERFLATYEILS